ncbi:hypothetical protein ACE1SV_09750 [Streptomyces sp. E-15]
MPSVLAAVRLVVLGAAEHQETGHGGGDHDGRRRDDRDQLRPAAAAPRRFGRGRGGLSPLRLLPVRARLRVLLVPGLLVRVGLRVTRLLSRLLVRVRLLVRILLRMLLRVLRAPWRLLIWPHGP